LSFFFLWLLILLESDLFFWTCFLYFVLLYCWFRALVLVSLRIRLIFLLLVMTASVRFTLIVLGLFINVPTLIWARLPGFLMLLIMRWPF
jgi:hypothetical protein